MPKEPDDKEVIQSHIMMAVLLIVLIALAVAFKLMGVK